MLENLLIQAVRRLTEAGVDTPRLDAEVLLAEVLNIPRVDLVLRRDGDLTDAQRAHFDALINERVQRRPVSQIIGRRDFWTRTILVDEHVLTPRPETEGIVEQALTLLPRDVEISILDIGTGSGCIAAALADEFPRAHITATDTSPAALAIAQKNVAFAAPRVDLLMGNLFDGFEPLNDRTIERSYDLIVSNPPYIPDNELASLPPEVKDYEPIQALAGGPDGLAILRQIAKDAPRYLNHGGWIILEVGMGQSEQVRDMLATDNSFTTITTNSDLAGIERIISAQRQ